MAREFRPVYLERTLPDTSGDIELAWIHNNVDWPISVIFATVSDTEEWICKRADEWRRRLHGQAVAEKYCAASLMDEIREAFARIR